MLSSFGLPQSGLGVCAARIAKLLQLVRSSDEWGQPATSSRLKAGLYWSDAREFTDFDAIYQSLDQHGAECRHSPKR